MSGLGSRSHSHSLYYSSLLSESPSVRDSTSRHATRFDSLEMSSMHLLPNALINQSLFPDLEHTLTDEHRSQPPSHPLHPLHPLPLSLPHHSSLHFDQQELQHQEEELEQDEDEDEAEEDHCATLFQQFFETARNHSSASDHVFDVVEELELLCQDHVTVTNSLVRSRVRTRSQSQRMQSVEHVLRLERNSWRLFRAVFEDKHRQTSASASASGVEDEEEDMCVDEMLVTRMSDKEVVAKRFDRDWRLRRMQLIVDWLERSEADDSEELRSDRVQFYSEGPHCWENTLHALKARDRDDKERPLCARMDPDAPIRTRRPLHDLDVEDEGRLFRYVFQLLRAGRLPEGKEVAQRLGYHWLSAALDGWLLHHDPNYDHKSVHHSTSQELEAVEGNAERDLWKHVCWRASKADGTGVYERAIFAVLSGNVHQVLPLCPRWNDRLWAYFKSSLDVHIEHELRETLVAKPEAKARHRVELPDQYWDNKLSAAEIFREMESHARSTCSSAEETHHHMIQKLIIVEDMPGLVDYMYECCQLIKEESAQSSHAHLLRFFAHLVLALRDLKVSTSRETLCVAILESYVTCLVERKRLEMVAFYTAQLPPSHQTSAFAKLLQSVDEENERKLCIVLAKNAGLDVNAITAAVVRNARTAPAPDTETQTEMEELHAPNELVQVTTGEDRKRISALEWLLFSEVQQWAEALLQTNALMRHFLLARKLDAMKDAFAKLPADIIDLLYRQWRRQTGSSQLDAQQDNAVREYLCHKAYIQAHDALQHWLHCVHNSKPRAPERPASKRFMDCVAFEHQLKEYESALDLWKRMLRKQSSLTAHNIQNVLLFPDGGWMADQRELEGNSASDECARRDQMHQLRRQYIPQLVFIALSVHKASENLSECLRIADFVADERTALYKTFSHHLLIDLLKKLRETSLQLLDHSSDPLGYPSL